MKLEKDVAIIGGAGPAAGILLAKLVTDICQADYGCKRDRDFPYFTLVSFPFSEMVEADEAKKIKGELEAVINQECQDAKLWTMACHTLHSYLPEGELPNTFVDMREETARVLQTPAVVLCTSTSRKYGIHRRFFQCDYPEATLQEQTDQLIDALLEKDPKETQQRTLHALLEQVGPRPVVLGCTELSLLNYHFPTAGVIDPLQLVAKRLCTLHFGESR